jgi:hypothetical protein
MVTFSANVNKDASDEYGTNNGGKYASGATINIRKPPRFTIRTGATASAQAVTEPTIPITLAQAGVDLAFTSAEMTYSLTQLQPKLQAAMATIANQIDYDGLLNAKNTVANTVGTAGTPPSTIGAITSVNQKLDEMGAPRDGQRSLIVAPSANAGLIGGLAGYFNSTAQLSEQYKKGMLVDSLGLNIAMDQNVVTHTNGTQVVGGGTVNGASQTGSTINVNTASITGTIPKGSVVTFAGVFAVNPQNRTSTGTLQQFVITADVAASATSITISPALTPTGAFQNVTASPANTAVMTVFGTASAAYVTNMGFHKDAFSLAVVPMFMPPSGKGVVAAEQESYNGFSLRMIQFYDGTNDKFITRFDTLYGWATPYPELACKLAG